MREATQSASSGGLLSRCPMPSRRGFLAGLGAAGVGLTLNSCRRGPEEEEINLYTWDNYTGRHTYEWFHKQTGMRVKASLFASNDEMFARLANGNPGYDVVVPTHHFVQRMAQAGLLVPLDHAKVPNLRNIAPQFRDVAPYDPGHRFSVPYMWLVIGIGYRKSKVDGVPDSWKWLLDSDRYKGRIAIYDQSDDLIRIAAKYLGKPATAIPSSTLSQIEQLYIRQKPNILAFHSDNGQDLLLSGDVDLVMEFNGDIAQVMLEDDDLDFVVPKEGSLIAADCLAIPKGCRDVDAAHRLINFLMEPKVAADIASTIFSPTPNEAALALMPRSYRDNHAIFPPPESMRNCEFTPYEGDAVAREFEHMLARIRAA